MKLCGVRVHQVAASVGLLATLAVLSGCAQWPTVVAEKAATSKSIEGKTPGKKTKDGEKTDTKEAANSTKKDAPKEAGKDATKDEPEQKAGAASAAARAAAGGLGAMPPTPPARPFAEVIKDAKEQKGLFTLWKKDDKVWIELKPEQFDQVYLLQANMSRGMMSELPPMVSHLRGNLVVFKKFGNNVQLVAKNYAHTAKPGTPMAIVTAEGTSDSLLIVVPAASQPHPERKSILIEANAIFMSDLPMFSYLIDLVFRTGYQLDRGNSSFRETASDDELTTFDLTLHYATPRIPIPSLMPTPFPMPQPRPATGVPDPRSFFVGLYYSLRSLPTEPMRPRAADQRVGHFNVLQWDFSDPEARFSRKYVVNRWRLEKKEPEAAMSEPKKPIVFWLDKNIPLEYRDTVRDGVLEWNKAFARIGFKDAIRVEQQPDDASWNTNDANRASIRWYVDYSGGSAAVGPSVADPRTGEILDADITIGNGWVTTSRRLAREQSWRPQPSRAAGNSINDVALEQALASAFADDQIGLAQAKQAFAKSLLPKREIASVVSAMLGTPHPRAGELAASGAFHSAGGALGAFGHADASCAYAESAMNEASFAMDLLALRATEASVPVDNEALEQIARAVLKQVVMHEVGHTLGLRHNFRASTAFASSERGISGSVMDYNGFNIAPNREPQGEIVMNSIGPYDHWAIEYAYKPLPEGSEKAELAKIAERSNEPELAYAADMELFGDFDGMDPEVNASDIGGDPLEYAKRRMQLSRELFDRLQARELARGEPHDVLLRNVGSGIGQMFQAFFIASKYVGGVVYVRDQAGSGRTPFTPVPAAKQRVALKFLVDNVLLQPGFRFKPEFVRRLADDALDYDGPPFDRSLDNTWWFMQMFTLSRLMSPNVAERIVNARSKLNSGESGLTLDELYESISTAIWGDLKSADIPAERRALQREHLRRLTSAVTRPLMISTTQGDVRALHRSTAKQLLSRAKQALASGRVTAMTRAHLEETVDTLEAVLKAQVARSPG